MSSSRRQFLGLTPVLLAAAALPKKLLAGSLPGLFEDRDNASPESFTAQTFLPHVNSSFAVIMDPAGSAGSTFLTLLSVSRLDTPQQELPAGARRQPAPQMDSFALHFLGTGEILRQGTYTVKHGALGKFPIFIVPSNSGSGRETYTAIYNHVAGIGALPPVRRVLKSKQ